MYTVVFVGGGLSLQTMFSLAAQSRGLVGAAFEMLLVGQGALPV